MSHEPEITALVRADGTGGVSIDGEMSELHADDVEGVRAAIIARVTEVAVAHDRPVRVATTDLDGIYPLIVHPNGDVDSDGPVILAESPDPGPSDGNDVRVDDDDDPVGWRLGDDSPVPVESDRGDLPESGGDQTDPTTDPRPSEPTLIPPPPFGFDDLLTPSDPADGFVSSPTRRSTFQSFEAALGFADDGAVDGSDRGGSHGDPDATQERAVVDDVPPDSDSADPPVDPALDLPAPGLDAFSPATAAAEAETDDPAPTLDDFLQSRPSASVGPAKKGWQGLVTRITGGLISPKPGKTERAHRDAIERVQRGLKGPRTIVVLNPKGGAHKTTATLLLAATFGIHRGGSTLAWDNNETRGTLGWRAQPSRHSNTAVDLLGDLDRFADVKSARVGYLDNYVRAQGDAQFDVLASDEDAAASSSIDAVAFRSLHSTLSRFYRVLVIDTGNNMRASNWEAAVEAADQLVVVTTVNEETAASAAWLLDGLRQKGHQDKVSQAVTILSSPGDTVQPELSQRLHSHFAALTRVVLEVPYDPGFQSGGPLNVDVLSPQTREAWLQVTAAVADGL